MAVAQCRGFAWHEPGSLPQYHVLEGRERMGRLGFVFQFTVCVGSLDFSRWLKCSLLFAFIALNLL